jgi:hypothetical protein
MARLQRHEKAMGGCRDKVGGCEMEKWEEEEEEDNPDVMTF